MCTAPGRERLSTRKCLRVICEKIFFEAVAVVDDKVVGRFKDDLRGAVVLLQADDSRVWIIVFETHDVMVVRAAP